MSSLTIRAWRRPPALAVVTSFLAYYHESRTHLSLGNDTPEARSVQPPERGTIIAIPQVGGLHHRYERRAA